MTPCNTALTIDLRGLGLSTCPSGRAHTVGVGAVPARRYSCGVWRKIIRVNQAHVPESTLSTILWVINIRYKIALSLCAILIACGLVYTQPFTTLLYPLPVVAVYLLTNAAYYYLLRGEPSPRRVNTIRMAQFPLELVVATVGMYATGGVLTPVSLIYVFSILVAIVLLDPSGVYWTAGMAALCYCALALLEAYRLIPYIKGYWGPRDVYEVASSATYALYVLVVASFFMVVAYMASRIALIIQERNWRIQSQLSDLRTLYDISKGLGSIANSGDMLGYLATTLKTLQDASICIISLLNEDGDFEIKASSGAPLEALSKIRKVDSTRPELSRLLKEGKPLIIEDMRADGIFRDLSVSRKTRSVHVFPIKADARVIGAMSLSFERPRPTIPEYHDLLTSIASQAGVALQRAQLFADTERLALQMSALYDFGLHTGSTLSTREVLRRTSASIEKLMNPDLYYIALYDPESETICFEVACEGGQSLPRLTVSTAEGGLTGHIVRSREPLLVQDWLNEGAPYHDIAEALGSDMLSYLGVPMISEDRVIGVISVQCTRTLAFTEHDERLLLALGAQTAMALENAHLHQQAQDQAKRDSLTQIFNHGHFVELTHKAVVAADRESAHVSLIMLDIDYFKKYNDSFGHVAGNNVLKLVAHALESNVKSTDAAGRWGGEEFAVLLPGATLEEGERVAKRIQAAIAELKPVDGYGNVIPGPTVSQGISTYPYPSPSANSLIEDADAALYHAKAHGRNQLTTCEAPGVLRLSMVTSPLQT